MINNDTKDVVVAILAKDKAYCLPFYLICLLNQTYDKKHIHLYIRTNDNTDNTEEVLEDFIDKHGSKYASVHYDKSSIMPKLKDMGEHEWAFDRLTVMGQIRDASIEYAIKKNAHYFVVDCDNFIVSNTLENMYSDRNLGVMAPLLRKTWWEYYANFHNKIDPNYGWLVEDEGYLPILYLHAKGKIYVECVHCSYFIPRNVLEEVEYSDGCGDKYEYAIFSLCMNRKNIPQVLDNTQFYGFLCHFGDDSSIETMSEWIMKEWATEYKQMLNGKVPSQRT